MDKYLRGSKFNIPMVSDEVPSGSLLSVAWGILRLAPTDETGDTSNSDSFLAVDNPSGEITLPVANVGARSVWQLNYSLINNLSTTYYYDLDIILESRETLIKGVNSFMNYYEAVLLAEEIGDIAFFKAASREDQIVNLISAYDVLKTLVYADRYGDHYDIGGYDDTKLNSLEPAFLRALQIAMIIEANDMLDANSLFRKRLDGLMSETIGESSMMFRPGNIQNFPVTRRSLNYLRNYIVIRARLGRA